MGKLFTLIGLLLFSGLATAQPSAEWISEIGVGYRIPELSSPLMDPRCVRAEIVTVAGGDNISHDVSGQGNYYACGGDNPVFAAWVIAKQWNRPWGYHRIGWWHLSSWFDGSNQFRNHSNEKDKAEITMNCLCYVAGISWTKIRERRRQKNQ